MKLILSSILFLLHFINTEANGETEAKVTNDGENKQLTDLIAPYDNDNSDAKRFHLSQEGAHFPFSDFTGSDPYFSPQRSDVPKPRPHQMTNAFNHVEDRDNRALAFLKANIPQFVFSSLHKKLVPKNEDSTEQEILKSLQPAITAGKIGPPELIRDAPDPDSSELQHQNNPNPVNIIRTTMISNTHERPTFNGPISPIKVKVPSSSEENHPFSIFRQPDITAGKLSFPEQMHDALDSHLDLMQHESNQVPVHIIGTTTITRTQGRPISKTPISQASPLSPSEYDLPFDHPYYKELPDNQPLSDEQGLSQSQYSSSNEDDSNKKPNKPNLKVALKASKLTITKIKTDASKHPAKDILDSLDSDEVDFHEALHEAEKARQPQCPTPADFIEGSRNLWNGFRNGETWSESFGALTHTTSNIANSVKLCAQRLWSGISYSLGFGGSNRKTRESAKAEGVPSTTPKSDLNSTTTKKP